ncbi:MAG: DUF1292 domain-containing protein [Clostridia bacterium]|nr:DUF1292 domain-containing protein [Clostridia bacterium]
MAKDTIVYTDEMLPLLDENAEEMPFHLVAHVTRNDKEYAVLEDPETEDGLMIFHVTPTEEGYEDFAPVESEEESEEIFYLFEAAFDDYEVGNAI